MRHFSRAAQGAFCAPLSSRLEFRHAVGAHATNKSLRPPLVNGGQVRNLRVAPFSGSSCAETTTTNNKLHGAPLFAAGRGASCNAIRRARDSTESTSCIILDSWPQECRLQASQRETSVRLPHASAPDKTTIIIVNIIRLRAGSLARRSPPPLKSASAASRSTCVQIVGWLANDTNSVLGSRRATPICVAQLEEAPAAGALCAQAAAAAAARWRRSSARDLLGARWKRRVRDSGGGGGGINYSRRHENAN